MHIKYTIKLLVIAILLSFLSGCGDQDSDSTTQSQVAAKVNYKEITVHQVNQVLKTVPSSTNQSSQEIANQILDQLINQEVLLQQALQLKLDRDPEVLSAIELAKRKVLIDAYAKKILKGASQPSEEEINKYYNDNPKFFSDRKIFTYTQFLIKVEGETAENLISSIKTNEDINQFKEQLDALELPYKINYKTSSSEKLAKPLLEPIYSLKVDDIGYLKMNDGLMIIKLTAIVDSPVTLAVAKPAITKHLTIEGRAKQSQKLVKDLRDQATVEYIGDFESVKKPATEK